MSKMVSVAEAKNQLKKANKRFVPLAKVIEDYEKKWGVDLGLDEEFGQLVN